MVEQAIVPIAHNANPQAEAIAGNSAIIFTATDREIIKRRAGEIDNKARTFREIFKEKPLTPEVENEEPTVPPEQDVNGIKSRLRQHERILKHSNHYTPRERVEIKNQLPDSFAEGLSNPPGSEKQSPDKKVVIKPEANNRISQKTAAIAKDLKLDPNEVFEKLSLEQDKLYSLISRIKELHLKRLFSETREEFVKDSEAIKKETFASAKAEARVWLGAQLDKLTLHAARYKLKLLKSIETIDKNHHQNVRWLEKIVAQLSK
ncbi:hypothetical protein ACFL31_02275 [Candidatus Margulisiibacteriota bacterium]